MESGRVMVYNRVRLTVMVTGHIICYNQVLFYQQTASLINKWFHCRVQFKSIGPLASLLRFMAFGPVAYGPVVDTVLPSSCDCTITSMGYVLCLSGRVSSTHAFK